MFWKFLEFSNTQENFVFRWFWKYGVWVIICCCFITVW